MIYLLLESIDVYRYIGQKKRASRLRARLTDAADRDDRLRIIRRKRLDQHPAAYGKLLLIQRVEALPPLLPYLDQTRSRQYPEVMTDCRLVHVHRIYDVVDAQPHAAQALHDLLPRIVGKSLGKCYGISAHRSYCIEDC